MWATLYTVYINSIQANTRRRLVLCRDVSRLAPGTLELNTTRNKKMSAMTSVARDCGHVSALGLRGFVTGLILFMVWGCQAPTTTQWSTLNNKIDQLQAELDAGQSSRTEIQHQLQTLNTQTSQHSEYLAPLQSDFNNLERIPDRVNDVVRNAVQSMCAPALPEPSACPTATVEMMEQRLVVGEIEDVRIDPPGFVMTARIDTGAESSSMHAEGITEFERDGDAWVRFKVTSDELDTTIERPVEKYVRVFQQSDKKGSRRPVVMLRVMVGTIQESFEFTLADRSHLAHRMILGRNFLTDLAVVDVGRRKVQPLPNDQP